MKRMGWLGFAIITGFVITIGARVGQVHASSSLAADMDLVQGALLYDKWYAALGVQPPAGDHPVWSRQSTNTRSGPDTWRCVECHGWDYKGVQGAYGSGSHYTGFPNVMALAASMEVEEIVSHLNGEKDPAHDFSPYLDNQSLMQLAIFLKEGTIDDIQYIDPISLQVIGGYIENGQERYEGTCAACHGADGRTIVFRTEGVDEYLGSVANRDPWRFLHRTRFGTAGTSMPVGYTLGWTPADGRDILAYAQTLPTGFEATASSPAGEQAEPAIQIGGPASTWWQGILTGLGAFLGTFGVSLVFIGGFLGIAVLVVFIFKKRK